MQDFRNCKINLVDAKLCEDKVDGFYLDLTYEIDTPNDIREIHIPKVLLPIDRHGLHISKEPNFSLGPIYFNNYLYLSDDTKLKIETVDKILYTERVVHTKTKKMTLQEIEEKLGHKVELVSEKLGGK